MRDRGISELADLARELPDPARRRALFAAVSASAWALVGRAAPFAAGIPAGLVPIASLHAAEDSVVATVDRDVLADVLPGKEGLRLLNDRPVNAETPAHLLDDAITPAKHLFVRNNGVPPVVSEAAATGWEVRVHGAACTRPQSFTVAQLRERFRSHTLQLQLECGGNGRAEFRPRASGNQWTTGAIGCPQWTGVRLADVLEHCGVERNAVYVAYGSADSHLSGDPAKRPISRGVPIAKAREKESLLAFAMNGAPIPAVHGAPLRMVCGGWPGSVCGKWVTEIMVRDRVHDGPKMTGSSYRVPCDPVAPGTVVADEDMCIIESMPVKSLITFPESGVRVLRNTTVHLRGHAWAGDRRVKDVHISTDFGASWRRAELQAPPNRLAWQRWESEVKLPQAGYHEVWVRATDNDGMAQPMLVPGWNPKGYLNNACHRIALQVV